MKKTVVIAACLLLQPLVTLAAQEAPVNLPSQAAIDACAGKTVGYAVKLPGKTGGMVTATCKDVNGQLVAIPKGRRGMHRKPGKIGKTDPLMPPTGPTSGVGP